MTRRLKSSTHWLLQYKRVFSSLNLTHRITRIFGNLDFESSLVSLWHKIVRPSSPATTSSSPSSASTFWIFLKSLGFFLHTFFYFQNCFWFILKPLNTLLISAMREESCLISSVTYTVAGCGKVWQIKVRERLWAPARVPGRGGGGARRLLHVVQGVAVHSVVPGVSVVVSRRQVAAAANIVLRNYQNKVRDDFIVRNALKNI